MEPARYLDDSRSPILEILIEYALERNAATRAECVEARDLRLFLNRIAQGLQEKINDKEIIPAHRIRLVHERRILSFLQEVLNTHAHEHGRDTRNLALAVSVSIDFFLQSVRIGSETGSHRRLRSLNDALLESILSEYGSSDDPETPEDDFGNRFDAIHDKLDLILLGISKDPAENEIHPPKQELPVRSRLESLRNEIDLAAKERGVEMKGYQHLLQWRRIDDLILAAPASIEELRDWSKTLPSYHQNKRWFDRQIDRWGGEIIQIFDAAR